MAAKKMHDGEVDTDVALVRRLLAAQFPQWADVPVVPIDTSGTVNAIYRLGDDLCVRLPRAEWWASDLDKELEWLPRLAPHLPLAVSEPVAKGGPAAGYPFPWAIYRWLAGETLLAAPVDEERRAATDLAHFVTALRRIDPADAPASRRIGPLRILDAETRAAIETVRDVIDPHAAIAAWESALHAPEWDRTPVWTHGDLLPPNLLATGGRLRAVIDFGSAGAGDPAVDVIPAWSVFARDGREVYRRALDVDDSTWVRARGFALHQALMIIPYYPETNPAFVTMAMRTVAEVLADCRV